jgi:hypothetical protein
LADGFTTLLVLCCLVLAASSSISANNDIQEQLVREVQALKIEVHHLTSTTTTAADLAKRHLPNATIGDYFLPGLRAAIDWTDLLADPPRLSISSDPSPSSTAGGSNADGKDAASSGKSERGGRKVPSSRGSKRDGVGSRERVLQACDKRC